MISGLITILAFVSFIAIALWAWSRHNRSRFESAARLPLDDDDAQLPPCCRRNGGAP